MLLCLLKALSLTVQLAPYEIQGCVEVAIQYGRVSIQLEPVRLKCHVACNVISGPFNPWSTWVTPTLALRIKL